MFQKVKLLFHNRDVIFLIEQSGENMKEAATEI